MRFSSVFQPPAAAPRAAPVRVAVPVEAAAQAPAAEAPPQELPDDLDARVRLIGEWQLGEAC